MDTITLQLLLKENNKQLIDFLKNEFMYSVKENILKEFKDEFTKLFSYKEEKKTKLCGFTRTRKRGSCKRVTKQILCPYHLENLRKETENYLLPDKKLSGNPSGNTINYNKYSVKIEDCEENFFIYSNHNKNVNLDLFEKKILQKEITKIKIYDYCNSNLPILKYYHEGNKTYDLINGNVYYQPCISDLGKITIKCKNIYRSDNNTPKLICYKTDNGINVKKKKNKKKKNKNKTIEQLYDIFNNKIKNYISYSKFEKEEIMYIKNIINKSLNKYKLKYKDNINYYIYDSSIIIHREIEKYIEKEIYHDIDIFNKMLRNIFIYYKIFALLVDEDTKDYEKEKWKPRLEDYIFITLKNF